MGGTVLQTSPQDEEPDVDIVTQECKEGEVNMS